MSSDRHIKNIEGVVDEVYKVFSETKIPGMRYLLRKYRVMKMNYREGYLTPIQYLTWLESTFIPELLEYVYRPELLQYVYNPKLFIINPKDYDYD